MITHVLLDDVTVDTFDPSSRVLVANLDYVEYGVLQVSIEGGTATVNIMGRISPTMPWEPIHQLSASAAKRTTLFPQMFASAFNVSPGTTVRVELHG